MPTQVKQDETASVISLPALLRVIVELCLIAFSSTKLAGDASDYAYGYYKNVLALSGTGGGLETVAEKGVHFVLFFALGTTLYYGLNVRRQWKLWCVIAICFLAGAGSESIQLLFPTRDPALLDVLLNGSSGTLAALIAQRWPAPEPVSHVPAIAREQPETRVDGGDRVG